MLQFPSVSQFQQPNSRPTLTATPRPDRSNLEDDEDIRILLDRGYPSTSSIRSETAPRPATRGGKPSDKTRPDCSHPYGRSRAGVKSPRGRSSPTLSRCKDLVRRPQTAGAGGRMRSLESRKINHSGAVHLRREMLLRSHGEGKNMHLFPAEPFKVTALGRKTCVVDPGRRTEV